MSRPYNPVVSSYINMKIDEEAPVKNKAASTGLLSPKTSRNFSTDEDLSQPVTRVKKHLQAIRERRTNVNGS
jgi:hypothetical protein